MGDHRYALNRFVRVPATGKHFSFSGISIWEFEGTKARRGWIYSYLPIVLSQLMARYSPPMC